MIIVPIGKLCLQGIGVGKREGIVNGLIGELEKGVKEVVKRSIDSVLESEVEKILKRKRHGRSKRMDKEMKGQACCRKCGSHMVRDFWRNGHYRRRLDTHWGQVEIEMPQVRCHCGGGVEMGYQTVRKGQRIWDDLEWEMQAEYGWGLSLRWIKAKEDRKLGSSLGLRTINERVNKLGQGWKNGEDECWMRPA